MPSTTPPWKIKRELLIRDTDRTGQEYGHKPYDRPAEEYIRYGIINLDKTAGPTSHEVAAWTKRILHLTRVGHGGTLEA